MKKFYTTALFAIVFSVVAFSQNAPKVSALDPTVKRLPASKVDASKMMTRGSKEAFHFRAVKNSVWGAKKAEAEQTSWVWDFEDEAQIEGWTFIDNDGDGHNWTYFNNTGLETGRMTAHEGEGLISSASYDNDTGTPLTPDNWMISPKMTLGGALKFWAAGQDASYSAEVFAVYVCVGDPAGVESFTKISDDITATAEYVEYGFDLSAYEGQEGCFAIRHYNVTDMFWLNIDDITLDIEETYVAPPMTPENVTADPTATTADIAWEQPDNAANWNLRYRPYTDPASMYQLIDLPYNGYEDQIADISIYDADGDGNNWGLYYSDDSQADLCFGSKSWDSSAGALTPDNWLFTPVFEFGGSVSFRAWAASTNYPENIGVFLIEGEELTQEAFDNAIQIGEDITVAGEQTYSFDLSEYSGKGMFAIRHYNVTDMYAVYVDDIMIVPANAAQPAEWIDVPDATSPYTIEGLTPETEYEAQVQAFKPAGEEGGDAVTSDWTASTRFTTLAIPPVAMPENVTVVADITTAEVSWEQSDDAAAWNLRYRPYTPEPEDEGEGGDPETPAKAEAEGEPEAEAEWTIVEVTEGPTYTIEGLTPETEYEVQVQAVKPAEEEGGEPIVSEWTKSTNFMTEAEPIEVVIPIEVAAENIGIHNADIKWTGHGEDKWNLRYRPSSSAPISEIVYDFPLDGYEAQLDAGWQIYDADGDGNNWNLAYSSEAQDDVCFYSASYANNEALTPDNWLFSPAFDLGGSVSFKSWNRSDSYPDTIAVYLIEAEELTEEAMANAKQLGEDIVPPAAGETYEFDLSEYSGKGIIAFRHYHCSDKWAVYIDDIVFKMPVDKEAEENSWTYVNDITEIPYTLEGLEPETQYDVEVQSVVGEETSDWSELYQFTTEGLEIPTDVTADNITESSADISWTGGEEQEWNIRYRVAATDEEKEVATIILTAGDVWEDGSGYQMLIDADATAYGTIIPETGGLTASGDVSDEIYGEFEYKIPENADGVLTTENIVINNSITIQIPAGTYDFCITNPTAGDRVWIASANGNIGGRYDDYEFEGGKTYEFTVSLGGSNDQVDVEITESGGEWTYINGVTEIPFTIDGLDPETTYEAEVQAAEGEHTSGWSEPVEFTTLVSTAIETVEKVATDKDVWYNINGVKLADKPTQKGVYIKNGKKVVVK